jgi:hypothetical protein
MTSKINNTHSQNQTSSIQGDERPKQTSAWNWTKTLFSWMTSSQPSLEGRVVQQEPLDVSNDEIEENGQRIDSFYTREKLSNTWNITGGFPRDDAFELTESPEETFSLADIESDDEDDEDESLPADLFEYTAPVEPRSKPGIFDPAPLAPPVQQETSNLSARELRTKFSELLQTDNDTLDLVFDKFFNGAREITKVKNKDNEFLVKFDTSRTGHIDKVRKTGDVSTDGDSRADDANFECAKEFICKINPSTRTMEFIQSGETAPIVVKSWIGNKYFTVRITLNSLQFTQDSHINLNCSKGAVSLDKGNPHARFRNTMTNLQWRT